MMSKNNLIYLIIFALVFPVAYFTPMHSDDFRYYLTGISPDAHFHHYMTWSGRVVADYVSTLILYSGSHFVASALNAIGITALIWVVSSIPNNGKGSALVPASIFVLYFLANPNLGQTTFWIVGAANYLWTNLFIGLFIFSLFRIKESDSKLKLLGIVFLGLVAGCSNENTSVTLIPITITICYIEYKRNLIEVPRALLIVASVIAGAAVLILSPGNGVRAQNHAFDAWKSMSVEDKILLHFSERIDYAFTSSWAVIAFAAAVLAINYVMRGGANRASVYFSGAFFLAFLFSNLVLVAAPSLPPRSFNGGFCLLLISLSFLINSIDNSNRIRTCIGPLTLSILVFIPSYYFLFNAYHRTFIQSEFRERSVRLDKDNGMKATRVPDFWFTTLLNEKQRFDFYHNGIVYGKYYGMDPIGLISPPFEYSLLVDGKRIAFDCIPYKGLTQSKMILKDGPAFIKTIVAFEFNGNTEMAAGDGGLSYKITYKTGDFDRKALSKYTIRFGDKFYFGFPISKRVSDIKKVDIERRTQDGSQLVCSKSF